MASLIPGFEYDIFISYRQKDNKYDGWVTEFVDNLKRELEATFKEEISVYFDINPHDGLLETHDVDASLKEKLKCLVFIPIISRTYCDPKSFAWDNEFRAFIYHTSQDKFGLETTLPDGDTASRVLPVRIYDLDPADIKLCESVLGGAIRSIDFVYKEPGVNRPLTPEDDEEKNLNNTRYRNQINKTANAIKEIISGLKSEPVTPVKEPGRYRESTKAEKHSDKRKKPVTAGILGQTSVRALIMLLLLILCIIGGFAIYKIVNLPDKGNSIAVIISPSIHSDTELRNISDIFAETIHDKLREIKRLNVRPRISSLQYQDTEGSLNAIRKELDVDYLLDGNIRRDGNDIIIWVELTSEKVNKQLWNNKYVWDKNRISQNSTEIVQEIARNLKAKLSPEELKQIESEPTKNAEANLDYTFANVISYDAWLSYNMGNRFLEAISFNSAILTYDKVIKNDSLFAQAYAKRAIARSWGYHARQLDSTQIGKCWADVNKALNINKDLPEVQIALGFYYYYCKKNDFEDALYHFKLAYEKSPEDYAPLFYMAMVYRKMGEWAKSQELIRKVISLNPQEALYLTNIGLSYGYLHKYDSALLFHQKAIDIMPIWSSPYSNKIDAVILKNGNINEARVIMDTAIRKTGDNFAEHKILLNIYERKFAEALLETKKSHPSDFEIKSNRYLYLAMINRYLSDKDNAIVYFDSALVSLNYDLVHDSINPLFHSAAGIAYAGKEDKEKAIKEADKARNLIKNIHQSESEVIINLAQIYTMIDDKDQAINTIEYLLKTPSFFSVKLLQLDPVWEPLMKKPEFNTLLTKYSKY